MNLVEAVTRCLSNYATFSGRATRAEYWWFWLFNTVMGAALGLMQSRADGGTGIAGLYGFAVFVPSIAVAARRLHDVGRSGWWQLIGLVPLIGWLVMLIWTCTRGQTGPNRYGQDPLADIDGRKG